MYNPTTRLLTILELLQVRGMLTSAELARRLEVDRRSVRRYITMLQDIGMPIESVRGPAGGYRMHPGSKPPPLIFTTEEAIVLELGLMTVERLGLALSPEALEGASAKLERVLSSETRERLRALQARLAIAPVVDSEEQAVDPELVTLLTLAARQGRQVQLHYRSEGGEETERLVDPFGIAQRHRLWYLIGYCHLRRDERVFRLDRVSRAELEPGTFAPPEDFDAYAHLMRRFAEFPGRWEVEVWIGISETEAERVISPEEGMVIAASEDDGEAGGIIFRGRFDDLDELAVRLAMVRHPVVVRKPPELREALRNLSRRLSEMAESEEPAGEA